MDEDPAFGDERIMAVAREAVRFIPDAGRMIYAAIRDPRLPKRAKYEAAACMGLLVVPLEAIPVVGELEVLTVLALALGRLVAGAGEELLREHWQGSDSGFRAFMILSTVGFHPRKALKHFALSRIGSRSPKQQ